MMLWYEENTDGMVVVGWKPIGMSPKHYDVATKPLVLDPGHELQQYELKDKRGLNLLVEKNKEELIRYFRN